MTDGPVRRLALADLDDCLRLAKDRGWPSEERKWRFLFGVGEVLGIDAPDGDGLAGTVIVTRYQGLPAYPPGLAAISMVLVASRYGRRGVGMRMMSHALTAAGAATVTLYATDAGRALYERLDFRVVEESTMYLGSFAEPGAQAQHSRPATPADRAMIGDLDARASGADRSRLLDAMPGLVEQIRVVERDGHAVAYGAAWRNDDVLVVGPVVAEDETAARGLIVDLCRGYDGTLRLDLGHNDAAMHDWARECGLVATADTAIMVHGDRDLPGARNLRVLPLMQALG